MISFSTIIVNIVKECAGVGLFVAAVVTSTGLTIRSMMFVRGLAS